MCILCREYRIPIRAALNGTAGVHTLKVVISPAAIVANQKAADYKYNVPGLTQPGTMLFLSSYTEICHLCSHLLLLRCHTAPVCMGCFGLNAIYHECSSRRGLLFPCIS